MYWPATPPTSTKYFHVPLPSHARIGHFSFPTSQQNPTLSFVCQPLRPIISTLFWIKNHLRVAYLAGLVLCQLLIFNTLQKCRIHLSNLTTTSSSILANTNYFICLLSQHCCTRSPLIDHLFNAVLENLLFSFSRCFRVYKQHNPSSSSLIY